MCTFAQADGYALPAYGLAFDAGMAHFWWSHVSVADQRGFSSISPPSCGAGQSSS